MQIDTNYSFNCTYRQTVVSHVLLSILSFSAVQSLYKFQSNSKRFSLSTQSISSTTMELVLEIIHIAAFSVLLCWLFMEFLRLRKDDSVVLLRDNRGLSLSSAAEIMIICNFTITIFYLGFCIYGFIWSSRTIIPLGSCFQAISWILVTSFAFYCNPTFPLVLVSWWLLSALLQLTSISIFFFRHFKSPALPAADFASFPLTAFLVFRSFSSSNSLHGLKVPLLLEEEGNAKTDIFTNSSLWSRLTFRWLNPVFESGRDRRLELHHVPSVPKSDTAHTAHALLQEALSVDKSELSPLPKAIVRAVSRPLIVNGVVAGINTLSSYLGPFLITNFVNFLSGKGSEFDSSYYGYALAFVFFFGKTVESMSQRQWYFGARQIGVRVRAALMVSIYDKCLVTKYSSRRSSGKVVNFLDVDVERIGDFFWYIHGIWLLPLQVSLALFILYRNLGLAASLSAFLVTVLVMLSNTPLAKTQEKLHSEIMEAKDSRIRATSEALKCMRILKLHSWENAWLDKLSKLRDVERSRLKRYLYTCSVICFLFWTSPTLVSVVAFGVCILVKTPLTPGTVLSALATFRILQEPIYNLPELISMITQTKVSMDRIQDFIKEDRQKKPLKPKRTSEASSNIAVEFEPGEYSWDPNSTTKKPTVKIDKRLTIVRGQKVAVCGSVGAGKSSLLCSMMGEIQKIYGARTKVFGSRAYVPQSAWIQTGTVRENVLFGKEMEKEQYEEVLKCCALSKDMEQWSDGDMTVIGERGMNLSGGQKQRIQLARAIYNNSDVYLLDDPFSAVDAHTGAHLFKECLMGLLSSKTVIYVTHQLELLHAADLVLVMKDGKIVQSGKYEHLIEETHGELMRQMTAHNQSLCQVAPPQGHGISSRKSRKTKEIELKEEKENDCITNTSLLERILEEERESGRVKWNIYRTFVTSAYKGALVPVILLCQILFLLLQMGSNYWIAWGTDKEDRVSREKLIGIFILMSLGSSFFILGRAVLLSTIAIETAQKLFHSMTSSIFRAPIFFFDSTPSSRILNRSSTDQATLDIDIPYRLAGLVFALVQLLGIIFLMCQAAWPVLILFVIVLAVSIWYQSYYICSARELARMVGIRKAPILQHFSESIAGAPTIRCFNQEDRFSAKNHALVDDYSRVTFHNSATMEWLCVRINFLFNLVFFLLLVILVRMPRSSTDPSLAGLAATYGLNLNVLQAWVIWNLCNVENKMISVERILQFANITSEAPLVIENCRPKDDWPNYGTIELDNLHVRYSPGLPMILKGISCIFPGEKKIGVVGRTGSGKSTLIQALFRMVEPSAGRIKIDGVDICQIGLQDLRSKLSIIPQEPTLFQGTMRTNLDPLQQHSDSEIWEALHKCHLAEIVKQDQRLLDAPVAEDGENWSVGQRQLVCLARVLLKKRKILVLDEATASVDTATDNFIQKTIREEARTCTVITVAHRIPTVIDSDQVLVLDEGRILEFSSPDGLLKDDASAFSKLVMEFLGKSSSNDDLELS